MSPKRRAENTVAAGLNPENRGKLWQNTQPRRNYEAMCSGLTASADRGGHQVMLIKDVLRAATFAE
jgi:hypothetical protein